MSLSRAMVMVTGSITAVVVTWCVNADIKATASMITATIRV